MKIKKYFVKCNSCTLRKYPYIGHARNYFLKHKDHHSRGHFRIEDRLGNVLMSNRLITKAA